MGLGLAFLRKRVNLHTQQQKKEKAELERKLETLEREKLLALAVLESMSEAVIAVDSSGKVLLVNQATEKLFGLDPNKVKGKNFLEAVRNTHLNEIILKALEQAKIQSEEMEMVTPIARFFRIQAAPLVQQGRTIGVIAVLHDVTQLKQLEQMRKEFVANASHELKTPLTSIQSAVETLLAGAMEDPGHHRQFLRCIEEDAGRLRRLIEDMLQLSRIESREAALQKQKVRAGDFLQEVIGVFKKNLQEKNISLESEWQEQTLIADPEQLRRAIENLMDNAVKYNKPNGKIWVRTKKEGNAVRIEVEDTGIGIPQGSLPRVFERFYRVDRARSRELGGTGLGLSIVKHIAERHGGRVEVTSQLGKGSCFTLWLPVC